VAATVAAMDVVAAATVAVASVAKAAAWAVAARAAAALAAAERKQHRLAHTSKSGGAQAAPTAWQAAETVKRW